MEDFFILAFAIIMGIAALIVAACRTSPQNDIVDIPYDKQEVLKKIFTDCINDVKNHLPYNIKSGTLQEQIFLSEVIFCITLLGLMYPVITGQIQESDKRNISVGYFAIQIVQNFLNNNIISRETFRKYYATRILIYSGQIIRFLRQFELSGINYDMERHIDNAFIATIEWVLYRLYYENITNFNSYNPLKASLNDMVYAHRINTQVDEFVYDINRAMLDYSDVVKDL